MGSNALHNTLALAIPTLLSLAATPFLVHRLGVECFGLYMLTLSVVGFGGLLDLGLHAASVTFVSQVAGKESADELNGVLNSILISRLAIATFVVTVGFALAPVACSEVLRVPEYLVADARYLVRVGSVNVGLGLIVGTLSGLPRAVHRFDIAARASVAASIALTGAAVALVAAGYGVRALALAELTVTATQLLFFWRLGHRLFPQWSFSAKTDAKWLRRLLGFGGFVALGNIAALVFTHVTRLLVGRFFGPMGVTYFSLPWSVNARVSQLSGALAEVVTPVAGSLSTTKDTRQLRELHRRAAKVLLLVCGSATVPLFLVAPDALTLWMGPTFGESSGPVLRMLLVSTLFQSLVLGSVAVLTGMGRAREANVPSLAGAAVSLLLIVTVAKGYGLPGVAAAVTAGMVVQAGLLEWNAARALECGWGHWKETWRVAVAAMVAVGVGAGVAPLFSGPWIRAMALSVAGFVLFHGVLFLLGSYGRADREMLFRQVSRALRGPGAERESRGRDA